MKALLKKAMVAGLVAGSALAVGCTRSEQRYPAENTEAAGRETSATTTENYAQSNAQFGDQSVADQTGAVGQSQDVNPDQDMVTDESVYGGSGSAGTMDESGMGGSGKKSMKMDGGMHSMMMDGGMHMMDGGMMMDHHMHMDGGMKMKK